ncbi:hypothetical protein [Kitasatospora herbaricolor]|uniref:Uncharacterized protein n=1 Tax=Kitasatospora herbaricolor TaxID=68217 RepID=A0ABZ1WJY2_9ACTN|nr:hypothetical protein [Kitasatospora herbaricolor]
MTTSSTGRRRRRSAPAPATPLPTGPAPVRPAPARSAPAATRSRTGPGRCCRTWSSERLLPGGAVSRTTWHEPACPARGRG